MIAIYNPTILKTIERIKVPRLDIDFPRLAVVFAALDLLIGSMGLQVLPALLA